MYVLFVVLCTVTKILVQGKKLARAGPFLVDQKM